VVENEPLRLSHCEGERIFGHGGARTADEVGLEFLGDPLDAETRTAGDQGVPITESHPESPQAKAFMALAEKVAARCSVLSFMEDVGAPAAGGAG
jgi:ATP-binding protein involved in chromosome partitioning